MFGTIFQMSLAQTRGIVTNWNDSRGIEGYRMKWRGVGGGNEKKEVSSGKSERTFPPKYYLQRMEEGDLERKRGKAGYVTSSEE